MNREEIINKCKEEVEDWDGESNVNEGGSNGENSWSHTQWNCIQKYELSQELSSLQQSNVTNTALASTLGPMGGAGVTAACIFGKSIIGTIKSLIS